MENKPSTLHSTQSTRQASVLSRSVTIAEGVGSGSSTVSPSSPEAFLPRILVETPEENISGATVTSTRDDSKLPRQPVQHQRSSFTRSSSLWGWLGFGRSAPTASSRTSDTILPSHPEEMNQKQQQPQQENGDSLTTSRSGRSNSIGLLQTDSSSSSTVQSSFSQEINVHGSGNSNSSDDALGTSVTRNAPDAPPKGALQYVAILYLLSKEVPIDYSHHLNSDMPTLTLTVVALLSDKMRCGFAAEFGPKNGGLLQNDDVKAVGDRDTLQSIAVKLNVTVGEITKLNHFTTRILFPGQVINVPDPNYVPPQPIHPPAEKTSSGASAGEGSGGSASPSTQNRHRTQSASATPGASTTKHRTSSNASMSGGGKHNRDTGSIITAASSDEYDCIENLVKARALYLPSKQLDDAIPGTLLVTPIAVVFDPAALAAAIAAAEQQQQQADESSSATASSTSTPSTLASLPPVLSREIVLPTGWIASVSIFRQIPGIVSMTHDHLHSNQSAPPVQTIGIQQSDFSASGSVLNIRGACRGSVSSRGRTATTSVTGIDEEPDELLTQTAAAVTITETETTETVRRVQSTPDDESAMSSSPPKQQQQQQQAQPQDSSLFSEVGGQLGQLAGAIGSPLRRTMARVQDLPTATVETFSTNTAPPLPPSGVPDLQSSTSTTLQQQQQSSSTSLSDPASLSSLFLRITGSTAKLAQSHATPGSVPPPATSSAAEVAASARTAAPDRSEFWFRIPAKSAKPLQLFFMHWNPTEMAGLDAVTASNNQTSSSSVTSFAPSSSSTPGRGQVASAPTSLIGSNGRVMGFRPPDASHRSSDGLVELSLKEWEVISIEESVKRSQAEDAEIRRNLPLPELHGESAILSHQHIRELSTILPPICIGSPWKLLYSTASDGFSLSSLFRTSSLGPDTPQLLVVADQTGAIFGAVTSCRLHISDHFYGSSDCCLFTFVNQSNIDSAAISSSSLALTPEAIISTCFRVFRWSGDNTFFIKGNRDMLAVGSSSGAAGLWLDGELYRGRTQRCSTFDNDLLTLSEDFTVSTVELWGFPS